MNCPKCGIEMEPGYLSSWTYMGISLLGPKLYGFGVDWYGGDKPERLRKAGLGGEVKIDGFRCKNCRLVLLQY